MRFREQAYDAAMVHSMPPPSDGCTQPGLMYEFRVTMPDTDADRDPSGRQGYYMRGRRVCDRVLVWTLASRLPQGTYLDVQLWKRWEHGRQVMTRGRGCRVLRYKVGVGRLIYVGQYEHP